MTVILGLLTAAAIGTAVAAALAVVAASLIAICVVADWLVKPNDRNNPITRWCRRG